MACLAHPQWMERMDGRIGRLERETNIKNLPHLRAGPALGLSLLVDLFIHREHLFTGSTCDLLRIQYPRYYIKLLLELFKYDYAHLEQCVTDASHMKL